MLCDDRYPLVERPSKFRKLYDVTGSLYPGDVVMTL